MNRPIFVILAVVVAAFVAFVAIDRISELLSFGDDTGARVEAELAVQRALELESALDSMRAERERLEQADSVRAAELADSVETWRQRAAARASQISELRREASNIATDVMAQLDSVQAVTFNAYVAQRDSIDAELIRENDELKTENAMLWDRVAGLDQIVAAATVELETMRAQVAEYRTALAAKDQVIASQRRQGFLLKGAVTLIALGEGARALGIFD